MELLRGLPATPEDTAEARIEMMRFGLSGTLTRLREARGWSKEQMAERTGRSVQSISRMESPYVAHSIDDLIRYAAVAFGAEVLLAIRVDSTLHQISDPAMAALSADPGYPLPWEGASDAN